MRLRELRLPVEPTPESKALCIRIRHPGYFDGEDILFTLPPLDVASGGDETDTTAETPHSADDAIYGIHHATALLAGQIISGNSFGASYLSYDRKGNDRVQIAQSGLLTRKDYFLQVQGNTTIEGASGDGDGGSDEGDYPITPNFQEWRFPHNTLPEPWASISTPSTQTAGSNVLPSLRCVITAAGPSTVESAHVIPHGPITATWFSTNSMKAYSSNTQMGNVDNPNNIFRLRADLHRDYDSRAFALVPKPNPGSENGCSLAVHFVSINDEIKDSATKFHNQLIHIPAVPREYLFARFAYTVFGLIKDFVLTAPQRRLIVVERGKTNWVTKTYQMDNSQRDKLYGAGGSRSSSPRKRVRGSATSQQDDGSTSSRCSTDLDEPRGRTRTRDWVFHDGANDSEEEPAAKKQRILEAPSSKQLTPPYVTPNDDNVRDSTDISHREIEGFGI